MSFTDAALKMVTKKDPKDGAPSTPSRSEREAKIKDRAGWVITVVAALLAVKVPPTVKLPVSVWFPVTVKLPLTLKSPAEPV